MIEIRNLRKTYGERTVLNIKELKIKEGETVVLIGPNGSGKTTLLKILAGVLKKTDGEINMNETVLYLPQQSIAFSKTVLKNVLFCAKGSKKENEKRAEELLSSLGLSELKNKKAKGLSGGELQRLALARVLINDCSLLLLDEPSSAADIEGGEIIEKALLDYRKRTGCTIIMTTHSPAQARHMATRIIMLHNGEIAEDEVSDFLLSSPSTEWGRKFISQWQLREDNFNA